jgi:hypothetical protein
MNHSFVISIKKIVIVFGVQKNFIIPDFSNKMSFSGEFLEKFFRRVLLGRRLTCHCSEW